MIHKQTIAERIKDFLMKPKNINKEFTNKQLAERLRIPEPSVRRATMNMQENDLEIKSSDEIPYTIKYNPAGTVIWFYRPRFSK